MARSAAARRGPRITYREFSDEDSNEDDGTYSAGTRQSTRASRRISSLKDPSTDDDASSSASEDFIELPVPKRKAAPRPVAKRTRAKKEQRSSIKRPRASHNQSQKRVKRSNPIKKPAVHIETDGICPPWQTLPYEVLQEIFENALASFPADEPKATSWLLGASRTCRGYAEPALSALYREPRLHKGTKIELFFNHMTTPNDRHLINYHTKVKRLDLDTRYLGNSFDLVALIRQLPRLAYLNLWSSRDTILRGHPSTANERYWQPPPDLIDTLGQLNVPLVSWHWNLRMMPMAPSVPIADRWARVLDLQQQKPLDRVKHLTLTNFRFSVDESDQFLDTTMKTMNMLHATNAQDYLPDLDPEVPLEDALTARDPFSDFVKAGPKIESLRFDHCSIVYGPWLMRLMPLRILEIDCSNFLTSWHLERYLESHGHRLQRLRLDHNPTLNLNFFATLKSTCPVLEELHMDLVYSNPNKISEVIPPNFDELLNPACVPSWPASLRDLHLVHLKFDSNAAMVLFDSIIGAHDELRNLRRLAISASIDLDWRERTTFRDKWTSAFVTTFLRRSSPPSAHLVSKKAFRQWNKKHSNLQNTTIRPERNDPDSARQLRSREPAPSLQSRVMVALGHEPQHGLCDVVDIRIDNSRPRENEFRESDFLDSEQSGDEDYDYE